MGKSAPLGSRPSFGSRSSIADLGIRMLGHYSLTRCRPAVGGSPVLAAGCRPAVGGCPVVQGSIVLVVRGSPAQNMTSAADLCWTN